MRIGMCCPLDRIKIVEKLGYDYMESTIVPVMNMTDDEYGRTREMVLDCGIRVEAFNAIFPGTIKLTGPEAYPGVIDAYLEKAIDRLAGLGCRTIVFGSGKSRTYPEGWTEAQAISQMERAVLKAGEIAAHYGILIVIEPLNSKESNIVTTVTSGYEMAMRLDRPNILLLADFYHMRLDGEDFRSIVDCGSIIRHTHIANKEGRAFPKERGEDDYDGFFAALAKAGYRLGLTVEGITSDFEADCARSLELLRKLASEYKV